MKITKLAFSLMMGIGTGCTTVPPASQVSMANLPNCFDANYDKERRLFTIKSDVGNAANQQCLLTVGARGEVASMPRLTAGSYRVYLTDGGGGGAGGTLQSYAGSTAGGGGGGGAGAVETQRTVNLTEGVYKLTIGAGGPGGSACLPKLGFGGGPGWVGGPSNIIRVATGEVVMGTPGADSYTRPSRAQNERAAGKMDGHGGSGPGEASGGQGAQAQTKGGTELSAQSGESKLSPSGTGVGVGGATGAASVGDRSPGSGGGGGATSIAHGGSGGGEELNQKEIAPERGSLGSGGGGGVGSNSACDPGARGGHGFIALRRS